MSLATSVCDVAQRKQEWSEDLVEQSMRSGEPLTPWFISKRKFGDICK